MEHGDDPRSKKKMIESRDKQAPRRGHGRTVGSSSAAPRVVGDRGRHEQYIEDEERLEMEGHTTRMNKFP